MTHALSTVLPLCIAAMVLSASAARGGDAVVPRALPFDLNEVRLLDGPFKRAQALDADYILSLDPDRLLHTFRINAKLPTSAKPLGGWESPGSEIRGHFVGHYLSACALMYRGTGDVRFKERADLIVAELAKCQSALGGEYLAAFPESFFDRLEAGTKVWVPYYTTHKVMAGLFDAYQCCGNAQALDVLKRMASYFKKRTDKLSDEQMAAVMKTEFGGMMEVLANLYGVTGDPDHLALSKRFYHHAVFDPLLAGEDRLDGLHANTQIPKMIGLARLYELTGDESYRTVARNFWEIVTTKHSFVTGGNSFSEVFKAPGVEATNLSPSTAETCNVYNMLKLTRRLFEHDPQAGYADYYERALYNQILASIDPDSGMCTYYYNLKPGHFAVYGSPLNSFWCCTGTGLENHATYGDSIYFHDADGQTLWVNLFIPSELKWEEKHLTLRQACDFPATPSTSLSVSAGTPTRLTLKLRVPYWSAGASASVNGEPLRTPPKDGYLSVSRTWHDGDRIDFALPMSLHVHRATDLPDHLAVMYGPIVLLGELGRDGMPPTDLLADRRQYDHTPDPAVPVLRVSDADPGASIKPIEGRPLTFSAQTATPDHPVTLVPIYQLHHQRYTVYWTSEAAR